MLKIGVMETKAKKKRRTRGKAWVREYQGSDILHAYRGKYKIPLITAINDLESMGVPLNAAEVARVKVNRHHNGEQQINRKTLAELNRTIRDATDE